MPIHINVFKNLIFDRLNSSVGSLVEIDQFYRDAEKQLEFDAHDLASTILKQRETGEPAWKRNLRNALQDLKSSGKIVNESPRFWRLPTPNPDSFIDPDTAWHTILTQAEKAMSNNDSWESPVERHGYQITDVAPLQIQIVRLATGTISNLSKSEVVRSFTQLNAAGGILGRRSMLNTVAKETAIVYLHPALSWDDSRNLIVVHNAMKAAKVAVLKEISEAENDDPVYQSYARKIRKGQATLRRNLLRLYDNKCALTGHGPDDVLQAAHIEPHNQSGNNHTTNAVLLRSDIHDLFDDGLLLIHPVTLKIFVHPTLTGTPYGDLAGQPLRERTDKVKPNAEKLIARWNQCYWNR